MTVPPRIDRTGGRWVVSSAAGPWSVGPSTSEVGVGVRGAGDLPGPEVGAVGLPRREGADARRRRSRSGRSGRARRCRRGSARPARRRRSPARGASESGAAPPPRLCTRNAVVDARQRVDRVDVGHEPERGLRLADRDHAPRPQPAEQHVGALRGPPGRPARRCRTRRCRRDGGAARSGPGSPPSGGGLRSSGGPPLTPTYCAETPTQASPSRSSSVWVDVQSGAASKPPRDVQPLDDDRAVESRAARRPAHQDPRRVRRRARRGVDRPPAVGGEGAVARVAAAVPARKNSSSHVAEGGEARSRWTRATAIPGPRSARPP